MKAVTNYIAFKNNEELVLKIREITKQYTANKIAVVNYELYNITKATYLDDKNNSIEGFTALLKLIIGQPQ